MSTSISVSASGSAPTQSELNELDALETQFYSDKNAIKDDKEQLIIELKQKKSDCMNELKTLKTNFLSKVRTLKQNMEKIKKDIRVKRSKLRRSGARFKSFSSKNRPSSKGASANGSTKGTPRVIDRTVSGNNDVELEIVFFSLDGNMTEKEKKNFEGIIKNRIFNPEVPEIIHKKSKFEFNDQYMPYFFRIPKDNDKLQKLESEKGLEDNAKDNFESTNFIGINTNIDPLCYDFLDQVSLDVFNITYENCNYYVNFDNLENFIDLLVSEYNMITLIKNNIGKSYLIDNYKKYLNDTQWLDYNKDLLKNSSGKYKIVLGIQIVKEIKFEKHQYINFNNNINCDNKKNNETIQDKYATYNDKGIDNFGNTCYFASILQFLLNIRHLLEIELNKIDFKVDKKLIIGEDNRKNKENLKLLIEILHLINSSSEKKIDDNSELKEKIRTISMNMFNQIGKQQDPTEIFTILGYLNDPERIFNVINHEEAYVKNKTIISKTELVDENEIFSHINNLVTSETKLNFINMQELFNFFINNASKGEKFSKENIVYIPYKKSNIFVTKNNEYIIFDFKLFLPNNTKRNNIKFKKYTDNLCIEKIGNDTDILSIFNVNLNKSIRDILNPNKIIIYELISLVEHQGTNATGGHYVNYSKRWRDKKPIWVQYNDDSSTIIEIDIEKYLDKNMKSSPYMYLYRRVGDA